MHERIPMPAHRRLPKNVYRRGRALYYRDQSSGLDRRISLGTDYPRAMQQYAQLMASGTPPQKLTVGVAAVKWLESIRGPRNARSWQVAEARVRRYLLPLLGRFALQSLTPDTLRQYRRDLEKLDLTPSTVAGILSDARCLVNWALEARLLVTSPIPRRWLPRLQQRMPDRLTDADLVRVLAIPEPWRWICKFLALTGLRWAEACRAQAADLQGTMLIVQQTKSGRIRRIPLDHEPELLVEIRTRIGRLCPYAECSPGSFAKAVRRHSRATRFHVHQLRHTAATRWLAMGFSLVWVQQALGHAAITTTSRYSALFDEHMLEESRRVAANGR